MMLRSVSLGVLAALGACSGNAEEKAGNTGSQGAAATADNAALANYAPPSVTSRADYGGVIERRFHRVDANRDDKVSLDELPGRNAQRQLDRYDKDSNKTLDSTEWGTLMLERFDRLDTNKDGSVTSEEREAVRSAREGRSEPDAALDEAENGNMM